MMLSMIEYPACKLLKSKGLETALWQSDHFVVPMMRGNARGGKEVAETP
jgi:hypothetical protein